MDSNRSARASSLAEHVQSSVAELSANPQHYPGVIEAVEDSSDLKYHLAGLLDPVDLNGSSQKNSSPNHVQNPVAGVLGNPRVHTAAIEAIFNTGDIHGRSVEVPELRDNETVGQELAEFELDSSPIQTSSEDSSDTSSDDDSDGDYVMLDPAEQARLLMAEGGSDDEGDKKTTSGQLRTTNEKLDEIVEKPNVILTQDIKIEQLGNVENVVDNVVLVAAKTSGKFQVLETSSVLCLEDRTLIGVVAETLGRVEQPFYSIRFINAAAISDAGISKGTLIFYVPQHSTFVLTQALQAVKGSDASNIHDEEIGADELEFSDDEAEMNYKRKQKMLKQTKREERMASGSGFSRGPLQRDRDSRNKFCNREAASCEVTGLDYDDINDDGLYTPLARPPNLHEGMHEGLGMSDFRHGEFSRGGRGGRGRGGYTKGYSRGNSDRGHSRTRGGRGPRDGRDPMARTASHLLQTRPPLDLSLPPIPQPPQSIGASDPRLMSASPIQPQPAFYSQQHHQQNTFPQSYSPDQNPAHKIQNHHSFPHPEIPMPGYQTQYQQYQSPSQYSQAIQQPSHSARFLPPQYAFQQAFTDQHGSESQSSPALPPGAFVNPAFLGRSQQSPNFQQIQYSHQNFPAQQFTTIKSGQSSQHEINSQHNGSLDSEAAFRAAQDRLSVLRQLSSGAPAPP